MTEGSAKVNDLEKAVSELEESVRVAQQHLEVAQRAPPRAAGGEFDEDERLHRCTLPSSLPHPVTP